jgi:acetate kinase
MTSSTKIRPDRYFGVSSDQRDLHAAIAEGNRRCALAVDVQVYSIKKYIGAYAAAMGGLDAVIFTGGIGENDETVRRMVCENMEFLGIRLDESRNAAASRKEAPITADGSKVSVWVVPTDEELLIARTPRRLWKLL